jgi:hypothetical protein
MTDSIVSTKKDTVVSSISIGTNITTNTVDTVLVHSEAGMVLVASETSTILIDNPTLSLLVTGLLGPQGLPGITEEDMLYSKRVDFVTDNIVYKGEALVGSSESSPIWRIRRITIASDNDVEEVWAAGNVNFDKVWTNRATLIYS